MQRLVVSLSSDKAFWDAIMNNELVRNLREPFCSGLDPVTSSLIKIPNIRLLLDKFQFFKTVANMTAVSVSVYKTNIL